MPEFNPKKLRVFLDMDDVLVDWTGEYVKLIGLNMNSPVVNHALEETWGIGDLIDENRMWDIIHHLGETWWANLPILPWGMELWNELNSRWPVTLLTSPSKGPSCLSGKKLWIDKTIPDASKNFLIGKNKNWCANPYSVLIDDRPKNCDEFKAAGGHTYLWPISTKMKRLIKEGRLNNLDIVTHCVNYIKNIEKDVENISYPKYDINSATYEFEKFQAAQA